MCLNVLTSLMSQDNILLNLSCTKQLTRLCVIKYDYLVYPYLSKELVFAKTLNLGDKHRTETLFTVAFCIHEIIAYRWAAKKTRIISQNAIKNRLQLFTLQGRITTLRSCCRLFQICWTSARYRTMKACALFWSTLSRYCVKARS
jgi:hypothetical protein